MTSYKVEISQGMSIQRALLQGFIFLGPLGNLLTPSFLPSAFRFYYFLLPAFFLFFRGVEVKIARLIGVFIPFFLYCFFSALYVELYEVPQEPYPLARFFLLLFHFLFVMGALPFLLPDKKEILTQYTRAFFISLCVGYLLYLGYGAGIFSFALIQKGSVLGQFGYGYLRFSPGSYPNEYGIMSSFVLSMMTLAFIGKEREVLNISRTTLLLFFPLTLIALALTTTRAAYLAYIGSLLYIVYKTGRYRLLGQLAAVFGLLFLFLYAMGIDLFSVFKLFFTLKHLEGGSIGERLSQWQEALSLFLERPWTGIGFARITNLHNVYLELFYEVGLLGTGLLTGALGITVFWTRFKHKREATLLSLVPFIGCFHVLWFACSNHNLNHHLTWFLFFLL